MKRKNATQLCPVWVTESRKPKAKELDRGTARYHLIYALTVAPAEALCLSLRSFASST